MRSSSPIRSALSTLDGEAWLRFVIAVVGLALAFFAALLSTLARESGNVAGTAVFASTALLLAGTVGVTVVPRLARRVVTSRFGNALDFEITREGMAYLGVALVIGVAALNTTNNLVFIVLAAMLAAIVVSGFASAATLRGLELEVAVPEAAFAGKSIAAHIRLHNPRHVIPAFSVRVTSRLKKKKKNKAGWEWRKTEFVFPRKSEWLRLPDYALRRKIPPQELPPIFERPVYFTFVAPGAMLDAEVQLTFSNRGRYSQDNFHLATRFPFSFLIKSRRVNLSRELLVYPALLETDDFLEMLPQITGEHSAPVRGQGSDLYRIREHTPQDPARFVDWKAAAKTGSLKVREFARDNERRLSIVFDNPAPGTVSPDAYERGVSIAASLAWHLSKEGADLSYFAPAYAGEPHLYGFLGYLAVVQPMAGESVLESLDAPADYKVIITGRKPGNIPTPILDSSHIIYMQE